MTAIQSNGINLEYESLGDPGAPVVLLVMGLGMQLVAWPDPFCEGLVRQGFRVVRFDNRDCGLSQKLDDLGTPRIGRAILRTLLGLPVRSPYALDAMARDTVGLLDALGIPAAHVVGASMGGMICQLVAALHPERTLSLTSIMSTTGARHLPQPSVRIRRELLRREAGLTPVERKVFHLVIAGDPNKMIAAELGCSERTVKAHRAQVMKKMGASSLPELVNFAARII